MATNNNQNGWISGLNYGAPLCAVQEQQPGTSPEINQYEQLDRPNTGCNTLKVKIYNLELNCFHKYSYL